MSSGTYGREKVRKRSALGAKVTYDEEQSWRNKGEAAINAEMERRLQAYIWRKWSQKRSGVVSGPPAKPIASGCSDATACQCGHARQDHTGRPMRCVAQGCGCVEYARQRRHA